MSKNHYNGGPAFPINEYADLEEASGMTLRDWFAGQAMQAMLTNPKIESLPDAHASGIAKWAYCQADAMLAEHYK